MSNRRNKLILEDTLNQIYNNNYFFDSSYKEFKFYDAKFIVVNDLCLYPQKETYTKVTLFAETMVIKVANISSDIHYMSIKNFSIHFED